MRYVYLLINTETGAVAAIYDDGDLANKMKVPVEQKLGVNLKVERRTLNQDISRIGLDR